MTKNIEIRQEEKKDFEQIYTVNKLAFNQETESKLVDKIRKSENFISKLSLVAIFNEKIIGHILFSKIKIAGEHIFETLALAPMAVTPEFQKQGVGKMLIITGLKKAKELGFDSVIVLGYPEYYSKFGFERASKWNIKCPFEVPDEAFMAIELIEKSLLNKAGTVIYPKEFSEET